MPQQPRPVDARELLGAFATLFRHLPPEDRDFRTRHALDLVSNNELDITGLFVIGPPESITGVILCQLLPGAGALVWPPSVHGVAPAIAEDALIHHATQWLQSRGARLGQCLLADDEAHFARSLTRNGFRDITGLTYLERECRFDIAELDATDQLDFDPYSNDNADLFCRTLQRSYAETLDCPEVQSVRTMDEVMTGHRGQTQSDLLHWWLIRRQRTPVGVLLMLEMSPEEWDVVYVGVLPEHRRQGIARIALLHGLLAARTLGAERVTLAVDDRNLPAMRLYRKLGFRRYDHRRVFLQIWRSADSDDPG